jgi:RNA polymerase sigma-70 factor, ECF subfamily
MPLASLSSTMSRHHEGAAASRSDGSGSVGIGDESCGAAGATGGDAGTGGRSGPHSPSDSTFDAVYRTYASFVWRSACRLGVPPSSAEDVMQEVFLVVHRRLSEFEAGTSMKAWLSAIVIWVVRAHRRTLRRKHPTAQMGVAVMEPDKVSDGAARSPLEEAERDEALRYLHEILGQMQDERREVFVLSELAQLTVPEIAQALRVNLNTVYWRLRTARREFEKIMFREQAARSRSHT